MSIFSKQQAGIGHLFLPIALVVLLVVGVVGWRLYDTQQISKDLSSATTAARKANSQPTATSYIFSSKGRYSYIFLSNKRSNIVNYCNGKKIPQIESVNSKNIKPAAFALPTRAADGSYPPLELNCTTNAPDTDANTYDFTFAKAKPSAIFKNADLAYFRSMGQQTRLEAPTCAYFHPNRHNGHNIQIYYVDKSELGGSCSPRPNVESFVYDDAVSVDGSTLSVKSLKVTSKKISYDVVVNPTSYRLQALLELPMSKVECSGTVSIGYGLRATIDDGATQGLKAIVGKWSKAKGCVFKGSVKLPSRLEAGEYGFDVRFSGNEYLSNTKHVTIYRTVK
jgi:hypothetical protein